MPRVIINGTIQPVRRSTRLRYDPSRGLESVDEYVTAGDNLNGLATQMRAAGIAYDLVRSTRISTLTASSTSSVGGFEVTTTDTWQLLGNEIQKDIRELPAVLNIEATYPGTIGKAYKQVEWWKEGKTASVAFDAGAVETGLALANLLARGTTHFPVGQYVLRHTTNAPSNHKENVADYGVGAVYSTSRLVSEITNRSYWINPCPSRLVYKIENIAAPPAATGYVWGWRKLPSTETTAAGNRIDISTEYWLEQWNNYIYTYLS